MPAEWIEQHVECHRGRCRPQDVVPERARQQGVVPGFGTLLADDLGQFDEPAEGLVHEGFRGPDLRAGLGGPRPVGVRLRQCAVPAEGQLAVELFPRLRAHRHQQIDMGSGSDVERDLEVVDPLGRELGERSLVLAQRRRTDPDGVVQMLDPALVRLVPRVEHRRDAHSPGHRGLRRVVFQGDPVLIGVPVAEEQVTAGEPDYERQRLGARTGSTFSISSRTHAYRGSVSSWYSPPPFKWPNTDCRTITPCGSRHLVHNTGAAVPGRQPCSPMPRSVLPHVARMTRRWRELTVEVRGQELQLHPLALVLHHVVLGRPGRTRLAHQQAVVEDVEAEQVPLPADRCPLLSLRFPPAARGGEIGFRSARRRAHRGGRGDELLIAPGRAGGGDAIDPATAPPVSARNPLRGRFGMTVPSVVVR